MASSNPAQQAAMNAGASQAVINSLASKKAAAKKAAEQVSSNPAQQAAINAGASQAVINSLASKAVTAPAPAIQNVAQAAATTAGASQGVINSLATAPNIAVPTAPTTNALLPTINTERENSLDVFLQRGDSSTFEPMPQPFAVPVAPASQVSNNPAQQAAINAGASQEVIDSLGGQPTDPIGWREGDSLAVQTLNQILSGQQDQSVIPSGGGGYSGKASTGSYTPNVTLPVAPGTVSSGTAGTGTTSGTGETPGSVVAPTSPVNMTNAYLEQLNNMAFDYDPSTDKDYLRAVAQTENAIIQSMIGRGGIYSSVAQSAVAVKLADLAIDYENIAYDKYVDQRNFMFERAQFEQSRLNTIWEQNFQLAQFDASLQQKKFENEMAIAEFNFALEKEAYNRKRQAAADARAAASLALQKQQAMLKQKQQEQQNAIANALYANNLDQQKYSEMVSRWERTGKADEEVAEYFAAYGVYEGASISNSTMLNAVRQKENYISSEAYKISEIAIQVGEAAIAAEYMSSFNQPAEVVIRGTTEANSDVTMFRNYNTLLNTATSVDTTEGYTQAINKLTDKDNYGNAVNALGEYYYKKLLNDLQQAKTNSGF